MGSTRRRACDSCYQRKIQCDATSSAAQCNWCLHHQLSCTYNRPIGRKVSARSKFKSKSKDTLALAKRLENIEARIEEFRTAGNDRGPGAAEVRPLDKRSLTAPNSQSASPTSKGDFEDEDNHLVGPISCPGRTLGVLCSANGFPYFTPHCERWIHSKTGEWPRFEAYSSHETIFPSLVPPSTHVSAMELPSRSTLNALLDRFFSSPFSRCFPFVDRVLFEETMTVAYTTPQNGATRSQMSAKACVFAFTSFASMKFSADRIGEAGDGDAYMQHTESILTTISGVANIATLQAVMMLAIYKAHCGHVAAGSFYHAMACRLVFTLGGHVRLPRFSESGILPIEERRHHQIRLMFWLCYIFDKETSLRSAQPPLMSDEYCDLTLPDGYVDHIYGARRSSYKPDEESKPWLISDIRLVIIKSKVAKELYSIASFKKSDAELLLTIRELDEELERWRLSIPAEFAPSLSIRKDVQLVEHLEQSGNMLQIELHLTYHHLLSIIHWASDRCVASRKNRDHYTNFGLQSSLDLSVEASRSTMIFLSVASHRLAGEAFWLFTFYPVSAFMSLFFNLLRHPESEYAELDLELLRTSSDTIRSMPRRLSTADEIAFLGKIDSFVEEISRLANCAVTKRQKEKREPMVTGSSGRQHG